MDEPGADATEPVETIAAVLQALALPLRLRIVIDLLDREDTAAALAQRLNTGYPTLAQHLRHLRVAGLVRRQRVGNHVRYTATPLGSTLVRAIIAGIGSRAQLDPANVISARPHQ